MKKKLLSLFLAGAMVASTSVSAFADATITNPDTEEPTTNISITGNVQNDSGEVPSGTFNVTIPTTASFTVKSDGTFVAPPAITVKNDGNQGIDIFAASFTDTNKDGGITVVKESDLKTHNRDHVSLKISGDSGTVFLGSVEGTAKGLYSKSDFTSQTGDFKLANIPSGGRGNLTLSGSAGDNTSVELDESIKANGVQDTFTLTLKIKKSAK